ncbi:GTP-binding protein engA [Heterostelium album PN500]|uniref:GTPase Der n=1 Tax=Heterostelium pallidum (strain ATCC 26659 / Pp 5 / PN500) TaxID=670386 RepID=D3BBS1_HETP5|nr:GTP-binding protein engA [Heterostelium album PN500]EFA81104.1 GTP-binding protein engA [Heterostelium album PN500]|eukprot:XP_020433222.1 GTP-binding protein engA [Heterostelium album PN500]
MNGVGRCIYRSLNRSVSLVDLPKNNLSSISSFERYKTSTIQSNIRSYHLYNNNNNNHISSSSNISRNRYYSSSQPINNDTDNNSDNKEQVKPVVHSDKVVFQRAKLKVNSNPLIAIIGKPNVGKSTLFNRVVQGGRQALVENIPGTTRDRYYSDAFLYGRQFQLVDTGGLVGEALAHTDRFSTAIKEQATVAMDEADAIIFLLDAKTGITSVDKELARMLRNRASKGQKVFLGINKADNDQLIDKLPRDELVRLGFGEPYAFSAIHGGGVLGLFDSVLKSLPLPKDNELLGDPQQNTSIKISIVGQPNAGKSSLLNQIIGEERAIVSDVAGTTHDPVDCQFLWRENHDLTLIDTAGIRRRSTHKVGLEKSSVLWAMKAIERSQVVLMVIDATVGITDQDLKIAGFILENNKSVMILVNKWDLYTQNKKKAAKIAEKKMFQDNQEKFKSNVSLLSDILNDYAEDNDNKNSSNNNNNVGKDKNRNKKNKTIRKLKEEVEEEDEDEEKDEEEEEENEEEDDQVRSKQSKKDKLKQKMLEKNSSELDFNNDIWPESYQQQKQQNAVNREQEIVDDIENQLDNIDFEENQDNDDDAFEVDDIDEDEEGEEDEDEDDDDVKEQKFIQAYWKYMSQLEKVQTEGKIPRHPPPNVQIPALTKEQKEFEKEIREKLTFLDFAPLIFTSAKTGFCVPTALDMAIKVFFEREKRLKIRELMDIIKQATFKHKLPRKGKSSLKIKFASQSKGFPPSFVFFVNDPEKVQPSFIRFLLNSIRETYPFVGTPINIFFRRNKKRAAYNKKK